MLKEGIENPEETQASALFGDLVHTPMRGRPTAAPAPLTVNFTTIESASIATKTISLDSAGSIVKSGAVNLHRGRVRRKSLKGDATAILNGLAETIQSFGPNNVLVLAPARTPSDDLELVMTSELAGKPEAIARTRKEFCPVAGPALLGLDFDTAEFPLDLLEKIRAAGSISNALASAFPGFSGAAVLRRASVSCGVRRKGGQTPTETGQHRYYIVPDGTAIETFVAKLADRLMLAGFVWGKISSAGGIFVRTLFDVDASKDTSRLFYEADAKLGEGLEYAPGAREPIVASGGMLDIKVAPLSAAERLKLEVIQDEVRQALAPQAAAVRERWVERRIADLIRKGRSPESARRAVTGAVERHILSEDFEIQLDDGTSVSVGEILDDRKRYHGATCADPLEPDYHGGTNLAIICTEQLPYRIISQAHGRIDYALPFRPADFFDDLGDEDPFETLADDSKPKPRLDLVHFGDAAAAALSRSTKPLIKGLLDQGALSVLYGESNVGKTFVAMDIAFHIATGLDWGLCRTAHLGVVYVAAEGGQGASRRALALQRRYGDVAGPANFQFRLAGVDLRRPDADLLPLIETVKACEDVGLVVIDTLSRALAGGDENASTDMGALVKNVDRLRQATRAHVMLVHHSGKERARGARGHSLLRAATDTEIEIADNEIAVTKQRDLDGNFRRAFVLETVTLGKDEDGDPITSCIVRLVSQNEKPQGRLTEGEEEVLAALRNLQEDNPSATGFKPEQVAGACAAIGKTIAVETVRTRLRSMEVKRLVLRPKVGFWSEKTDNLSGGIASTGIGFNDGSKTQPGVAR